MSTKNLVDKCSKIKGKINNVKKMTFWVFKA